MAPTGTTCLFVTVFVLLCSMSCISRDNGCKPGFTGKQCEINCALCEKGLCSQDGCIEGCIEGYFSSNDTKTCKKCQSGCTFCTSWLNCTSCVSGYRGRSCEHKCNYFCHNATCDKTTGECTHGCKNRYYKDKTQCLRCPPCDSCPTNECISSCCHITTRPACAIKICKTCKNNNPQFCNECLNGYHVTNNGTCELCSTNCKHKTCYPHNGTCIFGCTDGWQGPYCKESACTDNSCGLYRIKKDESGNQDDSGENSIVIGAGIGSAMFVLVAMVITTVILVRRNKRMQQNSNSLILTEAEATNVSTYQNTTSSSSNISVIQTTSQNTEMQTLPRTYDYVDVGNTDNTCNSYEALGKRDEHLYTKSTYETLGAREEHTYNKSSYDELRAPDGYVVGRTGDPSYVNKTGV